MRMTSISKLRSMSWGGEQAFRDFLDHIGMVEELRHEEGMQESISELKTLMHGQRIDQNSSNLMKLSGNLGERITKTLLYGKKGKSPIDLKVEKIKRALLDFAKQVKDEKNWKYKQYQERRKKISEKVKGIRVKGENCHLPWKEVSEFEDDEFDGFCSDFEQKWSKIRTDLEKGIENEEYVIGTFGEDTEEWKEATQKAHDLRENLRVQFELKNSYEELRTQLEEWEEDKQWKAREESNRRANVERNLPTIPEEEEDFENLATQNDMTDLTLNSPLEFANLQNSEQAEDRLSLPEQVVIDENESSENPELGGEENPSMHEGVK